MPTNRGGDQNIYSTSVNILRTFRVIKIFKGLTFDKQTISNIQFSAEKIMNYRIIQHKVELSGKSGLFPMTTHNYKK